jgi:hypothetical protein
MATPLPNVSLPGIVEKIIVSPHPSEPGKAQIAIEGADDLYRKICIENTLKDENGGEVSLQPGARVRVTVKAKSPATVAKR